MEYNLDLLADKGYYIFESFLDVEMTAAIVQEIEEIKATEGLKKAGIGKEQNFQIDSNQRGDSIRWIDPETASPATKNYLDKLRSLITALNRNFYLGIKDFECHYTEYPEGTFYNRHSDRHKTGSARKVSFVFYLNSDWKPEYGGQLRIYHEDETFVDVQPTAGTLAIFLSEKEHEVLTTNRPRKSITGWMLDEILI